MQRLRSRDSLDQNASGKGYALRSEQGYNRYGERSNGNRLYSALGNVYCGKIV